MHRNPRTSTMTPTLVNFSHKGLAIKGVAVEINPTIDEPFIVIAKDLKSLKRVLLLNRLAGMDKLSKIKKGTAVFVVNQKKVRK